MICLRHWSWTGAFAAVLAAAALSAPASRPTERPVRDTVQVLSEQGTAGLAAEDRQAALDAFLDAYQLIRTDRQIPPTDPLRIQTAHGLAVAYFRAGRVDKAGELFKNNEPLDRVLAAPATAPRSLVVNRAVLDMTQKFNVMRAVKTLKDYLSAHPTESDELLVNLLGTALDIAADDRFATTALYTEAMKFYESQSARLEAARPGERRWGVEWVTPMEFRRRTADRDGLVAAHRAAMDRLASARRTYTERASRVDEEKRKRKMNRPSDVEYATRQLQQAAEGVAAADAAATEARKAIPKFPWLTRLETVLPVEPATVVAVAPPPVAAVPKVPAIRPPTDTPALPADPVAPPADPVKLPADPPKHAEPARPSRVTRYAAAFPVAPDLLLTAASAVERADRIGLEDSQGNVFTATLVRTDAASGLALLRVEGQAFAFLNLADQYTGGGEVRCTGFPKVSIFAPVPEVISGRCGPIKPNDPAAWSVSLAANPRLAGAPIVTAKGELAGVAMAQRESAPGSIPAVRLDVIKSFLADDTPKVVCTNPDPGFVLMLTATVGK